MLLKGKSALVTGASRGLGRAVAERFCEEGAAELWLWARDLKRLEELREELEKKGCRARTASVDLSKVEDIESAFASMLAEAGAPPDILVNCAARPTIDDLVNIKAEDFDETFAVNVKGAFFVTKALVKALLEKKKPASIVHISSVTAKTGSAYGSVYSASKAAVIAMVQALSKELAPFNIRINAICPGAMDTDMLHRDSIDVMAKRFNSSHDAMLKGIISTIPQKRILPPSEVADFIAFLASDRAMSLTGQSINVASGMEVH
jgi:3-oxoacyl-[acyl-carrier protein] reductase